MFRRFAFLVVCALALPSFGFSSEPSPKFEEAPWTPPPFQKVVGYRFRLPADGATGPVPSGFTLLKDGVVDTAQLERLKQKSAELSAAQASKLLAAVNGDEVVYPAACYDPHYLFLYKTGEGKVVAAVEICFTCTGIRTIPEVKKSRWHRYDFASLAKLADELGLWQETRGVQDWEKAILSNRK
jgi:hypothetical protein